MFDRMKFSFLRPVLAAVLLGACVAGPTIRTVALNGYDHDTAFKSAVAGLCAEPDLLVYKADKEKGQIMLQGRGMMSGPPNMLVEIADTGGVPTATVYNIFFQDRLLETIQKGLPTRRSPQPTPAQDDIERQKFELEKQKLQLEREKLELEKQKMQQQQQQKQQPE